MKTSRNTKTKVSAKPKQTKRAPKQKAEKTLPQLLAGLARSIRYDTEDVVATRINGLWDSICQRNRAAENALREQLAQHEYAKGERNVLLQQRGEEIKELRASISAWEMHCARIENELAEAKKVHRIPQMVQLEIESVHKELDKERAATRAARAHAAYDRQRFISNMADRSAEKDAALREANERIAHLEEQLRVEREIHEQITTERRTRKRERPTLTVEVSAGVPPAKGDQFNVNETKGG